MMSRKKSLRHRHLEEAIFLYARKVADLAYWLPSENSKKNINHTTRHYRLFHTDRSCCIFISAVGKKGKRELAMGTTALSIEGKGRKVF